MLAGRKVILNLTVPTHLLQIKAHHTETVEVVVVVEDVAAVVEVVIVMIIVVVDEVILSVVIVLSEINKIVVSRKLISLLLSHLQMIVPAMTITLSKEMLRMILMDPIRRTLWQHMQLACTLR